MQHRVPAVLGLLEVRPPLFHWAHPLAHHRQDRQSIEGKVHVVVLHNGAFTDGKDVERRIEDGRTRFELERRVDIKVPGMSLDALPLMRLVLHPVLVRACLGDREVDLDGLREVLGKSVNEIMVQLGRRRDGLRARARTRVRCTVPGRRSSHPTESWS